MNIQILQGNIADSNAEAVVNAANQHLIAGSGVCGELFKKAGYSELQAECDKIGFCEIGQAVVTKGYNLKSKYIIHAVGPNYNLSLNPEESLKSAYLSSLKLAEKMGLQSIAFPCISTGVFGYPLEEATQIALKTILNFSARKIQKCFIYCYTIKEYATYLKIFHQFQNAELKTMTLLTEVNKFYVKHRTSYDKTEEQMREYIKEQEKAFSLLTQLEWTDITMLSKKNLRLINPSVLYDWSHITANYDKQQELSTLLADALKEE